MKINKNILLIGFLFGVIFFCSLKGCPGIIEGATFDDYEDEGLKVGMIEGLTNTLGDKAKDIARIAGGTIRKASEVKKIFTESSKVKKKKRKKIISSKYIE